MLDLAVGQRHLQVGDAGVSDVGAKEIEPLEVGQPNERQTGMMRREKAS